ncbi:sigma factor-like helix-turn-helix DNA-binding protein [Rhizomicrobium electricum]|uniref:sigma factor-like helix-turn-helix DNA-binding protein n=1 Tax=Rhizomicrobium electricum TaxID=480070 RepID=UPI00141F3251|nr:sigma factor-like helix-turn-helix DNA-binding protein [Rhizomicrobium electricum]NIJ50361.1 hypothetical protein [Rhizomicrobium electricum]
MGQGKNHRNQLDWSIQEVVEISDVSVRLRNAIKLSKDRLPYRTVREFLCAGPSASEQFLRLQHLGRKTANELDLILRSFAVQNSLNSPVDVSRTHSERAQVRLRGSLIRLFSKLTFPQVVAAFPSSTRLTNSLRSDVLDRRPFSEVLRDPAPIYSELRALPNIGRTSIQELHALLRKAVERFIQTRERSAPLVKVAVAVIMDDVGVSEEQVPALLSLAQGQPFRQGAAFAEHDGRCLSDLVLDFLAELNPRTRTVIERRYGIAQVERETLEQIAATWSVTRERIRQIEARGLRELAYPSRLRPIKDALNREAPGQVAVAFAGAVAIHETVGSRLFKRLPPTTRLAIDIVYHSAAKGAVEQLFFRQYCTQWKNGWLLKGRPVKELNQVLAVVKSRLRHRPLPVALDELFEGVDRGLGTTAVELGTGARLKEGYISLDRFGIRRSRMIRLHSRLSDMGGVQEIRDLLAQHHRAFPSDLCSVRDAEIVMAGAPHLFLRVVDESWRAIGPAAAASAARNEDAANETEEFDADPFISWEEEANVRSVIRSALAENGPQRFVDLRAICADRLCGQSVSSVGPILLTSGSFVRPLPGIYALPEQLPTSAILPFDPPKFLLSEEQAKWLAMARHSGEPFGLFPLWSPAAEYALCRWAQTNATRSVFRSLLAVSTIADWPVSSETREHWRNLQRNEALFQLDFLPRYPLSELLPPLDRVLAAAMYVQCRDRISWISANRILKRRLDASVSAGLLALMTVCGAVQPSSHWQGIHEPGPALSAIIQRLSGILHRAGYLDWGSSDGKAFVEEITREFKRHLGGWVDQMSAEQVLASAQADHLTTLVPTLDEEEPVSALESLLQEHRRKSEKMAMGSTIFSLTEMARENRGN